MTRTRVPTMRRVRAFGLSVTCAAALLAAGDAIAQEPGPAVAASATPSVAPLAGDPLLGLTDPGDDVRLSNETTVTRWTNAVRRSIVRAWPSGDATPIARLRPASSAFTAEIYGVLRGRVDSHGHIWLRVRVPGRPNGQVGWAPASSFGELHLTRTRLVINRATLRATLYRSGRPVWRAPVGVGKASTPTPRGHFFIVRKEGAVLGPAYGTHVLFTNGYSSLPSWPGGGAVGIHGTSQPQLVPGRPSHGCIRMRNSDIGRLARRVSVGTPIRVL